MSKEGLTITICYEASWRNSFLSGSNNEPLPPKGRDYIASMTELKKEGNYKKHEKIEINTVMGLLNRLIGDQRKLYQARQSEGYFFKDIEEKGLVSYDDKPSHISHEIVYLRNMKGSTDQNSFTGLIKVSDPIFKSDYSAELWGVLGLDFEQLCEFIADPNFEVTEQIACDPLSVSAQFEKLAKEKAVAVTEKVQLAIDALRQAFPDAEYVNAKEMVIPSMMYSGAIYIQIERLKQRFDLSGALTKTGVISGISKRGFTKKDFMDRFTTGGKKLIWGNPYLLKQKIKGQGEVVSTLCKASGKLEIYLDIPYQQARQIERMIEYAGVSTFYLGKKGLAYVHDMAAKRSRA